MNFASAWPFAPVLLASVASMLLAQLLKPFWYALLHRQWQWQRMFDTGGMPSSHTSLVTTLTLAIGLQEGTSSTLFAVALVFSLYFVFEATGLRQEVGHQAKLLNEMIEELVHEHELNMDARRLRELVGHTWSEVLGGMVVGVVVFFVARRMWM